MCSPLKSHSEVIRYTVGKCSFDSIVMAVSSEGICAIFIGDSPEDLIVDLYRRFPIALVERADELLAGMLNNVTEFIDNPRIPLILELDLRGTPFQKKVWHAVASIPYGNTASYADIALDIGMPRSARAVARACAVNSIAVVIPCHRVIRSDGTVAGYRFGAEHRTRLLNKEQET